VTSLSEGHSDRQNMPLFVPVWVYLLQIRIGDENTNEWVNIADAQLKKAIGIPSNYMEGNSTQHWEALCSLVGKQFYVQLKYDQVSKYFYFIKKE
jgi:hypothetical protein